MSALLDMDVLLRSDDKDLLRLQIHARVDLANAMVGTLYKGILADQIGALYERRNALPEVPQTEGYSGGYEQALSDVLLVLNGIRPGTRNYWRDWESA